MPRTYRLKRGLQFPSTYRLSLKDIFMKILQIGNTDLVGNRFNGHDLNKHFLKKGIDAQHCVWEKQSDDPNTWLLSGNFKRRILLFIILRAFEEKFSVQSLLYPFSYQLLFNRRFRSADIVHYHLIHTGFFNITSLPFLSRMKPSVWTLHDPWAMTGHCIYPYDCERWKTGCGKCPYLDTQFAMQKDHTSLMWKIKKISYKASKIDIIVASKWMLNMAEQSPLLSKFRLHHIPFGIDLDIFRPTDTEEAKRQLGVFPGSLVICFRTTESPFKGLSFIKECLHRLKIEQPVCLLTFNGRGLVDEFRGKYQIIDLGWVNDEKLTVAAYNAADIFLMPSTAEAFGMMAMEAMACGKPVIAFDGTSLPEVIFPPKGGIVVPQGDVDALHSALDRLIRNSDERLLLGRSARELAKQHYNFAIHAEKILDLYKEVIERRKQEKHQNFR